MRRSLIIFFVLISFPLFAQQQEKDSTLFFGNAPLDYEPQSNFLNGWHITPGESFVDSTVTYNGHKSLCLTSSASVPSQLFASYCIRMDDIDADSIAFSCKYKFDSDNKATLYLAVQQLYNNPTNSFKNGTASGKYVNSEQENFDEWQSFSIKEAIQPNVDGIVVYAYTSGTNTKIWLNDCKVYFDNKPLGDYVNVKYKAEEDHEFDKGSGIRLSALTPIMIENLEILGKVWGFLKYYHPEVAKGNYNWDYELFRVLPQIANAKDKTERNKLLKQWIDKYGEIKETKDYSISDSSMYSRIINLDWLNDKKMFDNELVSKFNQIRNAKRKKIHYYIQNYASHTDLNKSREPQYSDISWEDQGFRLLTLFKFWNAMEYNSPYVESTHHPWKSLLKEYIPLFLEPGSKQDYVLTLRKLFACLEDSHTQYSLPDSLSDPSDYYLPFKLIRTDNGGIVVKGSSINELAPGDIILKMDGEDVDTLIKKYIPIACSSNPSVRIYAILNYWLRLSKNPKLVVTFTRAGKEMTKIIDTYLIGGNSYRESTKNYEKEYELVSKNIAYIDMNVMQDDSIADFIAKNRMAKGIIIDMRDHSGHRFGVNSALNSWLVKGEKEYCWMAVNDKSYPGNYVCNDKIIVGTNNPDYYKGKVAILVNQNTMSVGELRSMAYREAANSKIIGTPTSGAAGAVGWFNLPGAIHFEYTAEGLYYPNWGEYERTGVKIDIPVKQTAEDIREGRDMWMEEAIQYIVSD